MFGADYFKVSSIIDGSFDTHLGPSDHSSTDHALISGDFNGIDNEEILENIADIADIIGCLLRLSVSIRNPAPHDHFMSSRLINTSHFEEYDMEHVKAKLPLTQPTLARRLGKAISQRRQYFKYREAHHQKLNAGLDLDPTRSEAGAQSTIASSIPGALKNGDKSHPGFGELEEEEASNSGASQTSYATSGPESGRLKIPSLPKSASDGPFECPFCYMMISVSTTIQWKKHVNADLRPYICLEPDCLTSEQQYSRRHEWLNHLSQKHWRVFRCPYSCQEADFSSHSELERHLRHNHSSLSAQKDLGMILDLCERPKPWPEEVECPLCQEALHSKREYVRHVGRHQTELALFALPSIRGGDEDEDGSDEITEHSNDGKVQVGNDSDSENSELSDALELEEEVLETPSALLDDPGQPSAANEGEQAYKCNICGRTFDAPHKLNHHSRYHDRTHECTYEGCDRKFGTKTHLDRHIADRHLKRKTYHCTEPSCRWFKGGRSFPRKDNWRRHMIKKHGATPEDFANMDLSSG
ncbi:hypothetical protein F5Y03DRAFT_75775 [Xylaria venustula]|nr:hypothetical protein F5Y03DRAFT_75775 [Xylaria venustula]